MSNIFDHLKRTYPPSLESQELSRKRFSRNLFAHENHVRNSCLRYAFLPTPPPKKNAPADVSLLSRVWLPCFIRVYITLYRQDFSGIKTDNLGSNEKGPPCVSFVCTQKYYLLANEYC
uniref:Uncharacterized protein n=1 Tax=Proboscia inermis TaxID=420281 RepID=A0A7S0GIS3_9STRA